MEHDHSSHSVGGGATHDSLCMASSSMPGMTMYMTGFHSTLFESDLPCLNLYSTKCTLVRSQTFYSFGCWGCPHGHTVVVMELLTCWIYLYMCLNPYIPCFIFQELGRQGSNGHDGSGWFGNTCRSPSSGESRIFKYDFVPLVHVPVDRSKSNELTLLSIAILYLYLQSGDSNI